MTKTEFQNLTGKSAAQVRKLCDKGEFYVDGHGAFRAVKGRSKTAPIDIRPVNSKAVADEPAEFQTAGAVNNSKLSKLREAKIAIEIQTLQQKLHERQEAIEREFAQEVIAQLTAALTPLKEAFRACKLTKEQSDLIDAALTESLRHVESLLNR